MQCKFLESVTMSIYKINNNSHVLTNAYLEGYSTPSLPTNPPQRTEKRVVAPHLYFYKQRNHGHGGVAIRRQLLTRASELHWVSLQHRIVRPAQIDFLAARRRSWKFFYWTRLMVYDDKCAHVIYFSPKLPQLVCPTHLSLWKWRGVPLRSTGE